MKGISIKRKNRVMGKFFILLFIRSTGRDLSDERLSLAETIRFAVRFRKNKIYKCIRANAFFIYLAIPFMMSLLIGCQTSTAPTEKSTWPPAAEGPEFSLIDAPPEKSIVYVYNPHVGDGRNAPFYICHARTLVPGEMPGEQDDFVLIDPVKVPVPEGWSPESVKSFTAARLYDMKALRQGQPYNIKDIAQKRVRGGMSATDKTMLVKRYIGNSEISPYIFRTADQETLASDLSLAEEHGEISALALKVVPKFLQWGGYFALELEPGTKHLLVIQKRDKFPRKAIKPIKDDLDRIITVDLKPGQRHFVKLARRMNRLQQVSESEAMTPNSRFQIRPLGILDCRLILTTQLE